jgi:predicted Zn-dependent protease
MTFRYTDTDDHFERAASLLVASAPEALGRFSREGVHADFFLSASSNSILERHCARRSRVEWSESDSSDFAAALNVIFGSDAFLGVFDPLRPGAINEALKAATSIIPGGGERVDFADPAPASVPGGFSSERARMYLEELDDALSDVLDPRSIRIAFDSRRRRRLVINGQGRAEESQDVTNRVIVGGRVPASGPPREVHHIADPEDFHEAAEVADFMRRKVQAAGEVRLLRPDRYSVIMKSGWAGTWIHEIVGHMLEADVFFEGPFQTMLGSRVAPPFVTVLDGPGISHLDDEGSMTSATTLIEGGVLVGLLADQRASHRRGIAPSGNGFRSTASKPPLPRMTSIRLEPGSASLDDLIATMGDGILVDDFRSAQVLLDGTVRIDGASGERIESGRRTHPVGGLSLRGSAVEWLNRIQGIASDTEVEQTRGICLKAGQPHRVITIAPSALISGISIEQA